MTAFLFGLTILLGALYLAAVFDEKMPYGADKCSECGGSIWSAKKPVCVNCGEWN